MRQFTTKEFIRILNNNGFHYVRSNGSHYIYKNSDGNHISIPLKLSCVIAQRLIKENDLNID